MNFRRESVWGAELRAMLRLSVPVVLSELGWMAMGVVDTIMVGKLGPSAIGAIAVGNAVYYAPSLFGIGLVLGLDTLVSQAHGAGDHDECHRWLAQGIYLTAIITPISMLLVAWLAAHFALLGINPAVSGLASQYLSLMNWGTFPLLIYAASRRYLQGVGRVKPILFIFLTANLVNWIGNWVLIYGKWGMPALGVRGSALSTVCSRILMAVGLMTFAWLHESRRGHPLFARWPLPQVSRLRQLLALGLPAGGQIVMEVGAFGAATVLAGRLSPESLAAHQVALNCASLTYMVPLGVGAAAAVRVGYGVGAQDGSRARRSGWTALGLAIGFMLMAGVVFLLIPRQILGVYSHDLSMIKIGIPLLAIAAAFQVFDGIQTVSTGALRGLGETKMPMLANLIGYWIFGLPLGYILCFHTPLGIFGIWTGLTAALITIALWLMLHWRTASKRLPCSVAQESST